MKPIITHALISSLEGETGSNPEIHTIFPNDSGIKKENIISYALPQGARSGEVHEFSYKRQDLVVFVSDLKVEGRRPDIVTISLLLNDHIDKNTIISIMKTIFSEFQIDNFKGIDEFTDFVKKLCLGFNSGNFNMNSYSFDIHGYVSNTGLSIERNARKVQGGLF
ncbi:MAG: hypothetical protein ACTSRE_12100 [Promethearchaeota archaeon]